MDATELEYNVIADTTTVITIVNFTLSPKGSPHASPHYLHPKTQPLPMAPLQPTPFTSMNKDATVMQYSPCPQYLYH
jgi:hypothetical protein